MIGGLALAGGGFDVSSRHIAGLAVWLLIVVLLVVGAAARTTVGKPFRWAFGLIGGLALWSAISSLWSGAVELSVVEADAVLAYLGFFLLAFLLAQTEVRRQRFAEGLAIALVFVAFLGLGSRFLPHVLDVNSLGTGPRLRYPLGYWNANGAICGIGVTLLLWMSRRAGAALLRWLSVAAMPAVLLTLYVTYSRGGLLALVISAACLLALSRDRLWLLGTLAAGLLGALPALLAVQSRGSLANNVTSQTTVQQGAVVLAILVAGAALSLLLFALLRRGERGGGRRVARAVEISRSPRLLRSIALAFAVLAIGAAIAVGGRAWHQFNSPDIQFPSEPQQHFGQFIGAGRREFWRVAIDSYSSHPLLGTGAGTYQFAWDQHRSVQMVVLDAHSLYLEAFAELGTVGGLLVIALIGGLLWIGFSAWRAAPHPQRDAIAALFAAMLALALGFAIDWLWEIAAMAAVFFLAAGVLVAVRCAQLAGAARRRERGGSRNYGLGVASLVLAWVAALALIGPLLVERELASSRSAAAAGNTENAVEHADMARSVEPWAASPYVQLGLLAELKREYGTAELRLSQAIAREDRNWELFYLRARVEREAGDASAAQADLARARELNPLQECLRSGNCG